MARDVTSDDLNKQQKARGQRIDKQYYRKSHPWRSKMLMLSWLLPIIGLAVLGAYTFMPSGEAIYMPGPVSTKHSMFADRCDACHAQGKDEKGTVHYGAVTDAKCMSCHDGPLHMANQAFPHNVQEWDFAEKVVDANGVETLKTRKITAGNPTCASCHAEHKGHGRLAELNDRHCTQCHANLTVSSGPIKVATNIKSFNNGHPDWQILKKPAPRDGTPFKFNHEVHFKASVKKADGTNMNCSDCHKPDQHRAYMEPINYEAHCMACHPSAIHEVANIGSVALPHGKPALVEAVVKTAFSDYLLKAGGKLPPKLVENPKYVKPKPGRPKPKEPEFLEEADPRPPEQWRKEQVDNTLQPLFFPNSKQEASSCQYCHVNEGKDDKTGLPKITDPKIPSVWLPKSIFDHEVHRVVNCAECHVGVNTSKTTGDLLLPDLKSCQVCHKVDGGARSGCMECHVYHDKATAHKISPLTMEELIKGGIKTKPAEKPAGNKEGAPADPAAAPPAEAPKAEEPKKEEAKPEEKK